MRSKSLFELASVPAVHSKSLFEPAVQDHYSKVLVSVALCSESLYSALLCYVHGYARVPTSLFERTGGTGAGLSGHFERTGGAEAGPNCPSERSSSSRAGPSSHFERQSGSRAVNSGVFAGAAGAEKLQSVQSACEPPCGNLDIRYAKAGPEQPFRALQQHPGRPERPF